MTLVYSAARRQWLQQVMASAALASPLSQALASKRLPTKDAPAPPSTLVRPPQLAPTLRIVMPANAGGGWDQTGRALGAALISSGITNDVIYENIGGKGGTIGLAKYVERFSSEPDTLLIGGMVMMGALALHQSAINLSQVNPLARLTSDYLVAVTPIDSPIQNAKDLKNAMRKDLRALPIAGGSAGGVDHMFAGLLTRASKVPAEQLQYKAYPGGGDVLQALLQNEVQVGISGYSELSSEIKSGKLRAIGISSRHTTFDIPSFHDQGVDAEMSNWRAVFTGKNVSAERQAQMATALEYTVNRDAWKRTLQRNHWNSSWLTGKPLNEFLEMENAMAQLIIYLLKLKP